MAQANNVDVEKFLEQFLKDNRIHEGNGWRNLILADEVRYTLRDVILELNLQGNNAKWPYAPHANQILRAFALCKPEDIKVIIIGSSPITGGLANGLAFSSKRAENELADYQAIPKVHKALKDAKILDKDVKYYHCGHNEWARRGVLLLNAALTIPSDDDSAPNMRFHCDKWKPFLAELLKKWMSNLKRPESEQGIFVMLWGRALGKYPNYAKEVWDAATEGLDVKFIVLSTDHPTFPKISNKPNAVQNKFSEEAPSHFQQINAKHEGIFTTSRVEAGDMDHLMEGLYKLKL